MKLLSMTDFVLEQKSNGLTTTTCFINCLAYAEFLNTEISLSDIFPCDENIKPFGKYIELGKGLLQKYEEAKKKLIFDIKIDLDTAKFHVKQKRKVEYFTAFDIKISDYAVEKFLLER